MRLGVIADVHGNRRALQAVLDRLASIGVDRLVCAGDVVGWGPDPNACIDLLAEADALVVAGNHDLIVADLLGDDRCSQLARDTQAWTRAALRDDARAWLAALPRQARVGPVVVAHGSLDDPEEYVRSEVRATEQLRQMQQLDPLARLLVLGHTHHPWVLAEGLGTRTRSTPAQVSTRGVPHLLNPGSVGQSRVWEHHPRARFATVDLSAGRIRLRQVEYDWRSARADARRAGLPPEAVHAPPRSPARLVRRLRRGLRERAAGRARAPHAAEAR